MIALDTNVLVRFLTRDDAAQAARAEACMAALSEDEPGFIAREVVLELVWVLARAYHFTRTEIAAALEGLLSAIELEVEDAETLGAVLGLYVGEAHDFADLVIREVGLRAGVSRLVTFDVKASRLDDVELL